MKTIALVSLLVSAASAAFAQKPSSQIANLSSLGQVGQNAGNLIAGFVVEGSAPKTLLIRGTGPGLAAFGDSNPAAAVGVVVYDSGGNVVAANSGFQTDPNFVTAEQTAAQLGAFQLPDPSDSELLVSLAPGAYSIEIAPNAADAADGDALLEVYDADAPGSGSTIANLSTRGQVGATAGSLTTGFVVSGTAPKNLLVRGIGPDLAQFGVTNTAAAVGINVYDANGNLVATNRGFQTDPNAAAIEQLWGEVGAFPMTDPGNSELRLNLAPGNYTVEVVPTSADAPNGVGMVEVYDADAAMAASAPSGN